MRDDRSVRHQQSHFLPGLIVGAGLMFLLGTKKGREITKVLIEEGSGKFNEFLNQQRESFNEIEKAEVLHEPLNSIQDSVSSGEVKVEPHPKKKLFKNAHKK